MNLDNSTICIDWQFHFCFGLYKQTFITYREITRWYGSGLKHNKNCWPTNKQQLSDKQATARWQSYKWPTVNWQMAISIFWELFFTFTCTFCYVANMPLCKDNGITSLCNYAYVLVSHVWTRLDRHLLEWQLVPFVSNRVLVVALVVAGYSVILVILQHPVQFNHRNSWSANSACIVSRHGQLFIIFDHFCLFYCSTDKYHALTRKDDCSIWRNVL